MITLPFRGTYDLLPLDYMQHNAIIDKARHIATLYGFQEISTPIFEYARTFLHTLGETSDIVTKEMFTMTDRHGDLLSLRPEGTAGVMRAVLSNNLYQGNPLKFFYHGPMFRYERPQKGRNRQFHQIGIENIGEPHPYGDVEVIALGFQLLDTLGLKNAVTLEINTLGDKESRDAYRNALVDYFKDYENDLSEDSKARLLKNPLRILDSKDRGDQILIENAPKMEDFLNTTSKNFFDTVQSGLSKVGIPYKINHRLVRGLDYYCHTAFEFTTTLLGSQNAVLAGGRFDGLSQKMGGPALPSVGWAAGIERLALLTKPTTQKIRPVSLVPLGNDAQTQAISLLFHLREKNIPTDLAWEGSLKSRMKRANRLNAQWALIFGDEELQEQTITAKNLDTGEQQTLSLNNLDDFLTHEL